MTWHRSVALVVSVVIVATACESAPSPVPTAGRSAPPPSASSAITAAGPMDYEQLLHGFKYTPSTGTPGGKVTIGYTVRPHSAEPVLLERLLGHAGDRGHDADPADRCRRRPLDAVAVRWVDHLLEQRKMDEGSSAGFRVHVRIKPNLTWSDGAPFSLNDLKYTWTAVLEAAQARTNIAPLGWEEVDRIDISADGVEADVHFREPFAGWLATLGSNVILPEHYMKTIPYGDWQRRSYPVSAGRRQCGDARPLQVRGRYRRHDRPRPRRQLGRPSLGMW